MTIQETYEKIIERIRSKENIEKYSHLVNSPNKTAAEEKLSDNITTVTMYIEQIKKYSSENKTLLELLESGCRRLLPKIEKQLNDEQWK